MKKVKVQYFAMLREQSGRLEEEVVTSAADAAGLFAELSARYVFSLPAAAVKASINLQFKPLDTELQDGDAVVFIPPVAGG